MGKIAGTDKIENWHLKELGEYKFNIKALLNESFNAQEHYGNNAKVWDKDLTGPLFQLPVCINDALRLYDLHKHTIYLQRLSFPSSYYQFPWICGDLSGNQTTQFMAAMNLGPTSDKYLGLESVQGTQHHNALWWDRIPRVRIFSIMFSAALLINCSARGRGILLQ